MNAIRSIYKGCAITTRWIELDSLSGNLARRFTASFLVVPAIGEEPWQEFASAVFASSSGASAAALTAAQTSIDLNKPGW
jgi:hypothetical protein